MRQIHLVLTTAAGDDIGRLPVPGVAVADAGVALGPPSNTEPVETEKPGPLIQQMDEVCAAIEESLAAEGLKPASDALGLRIAVSRALLAPAASDGPVPVPLAVRERTETDTSGTGSDESLRGDADPQVGAAEGVLPASGIEGGPGVTAPDTPEPTDLDALFTLDDAPEQGGKP